MKRQVQCSAPGKVLIAGGYLILDRPNKGVVISTTARFHSNLTEIGSNNDLPNIYQIIVNSPQFSSQNQIQIQFNPENESFTLSENSSKIPIYIRLCIQIGISISYLESDKDKFFKILESGINITLQADNDFYSQQQLVGKNKNI